MDISSSGIPAIVMALACFGIEAVGEEPAKNSAPASESTPAIPAAGHSIHGETFDDGPRHEAKLLEGMGKIHFPVTTTRVEAQAFIDQGVAQLHSFYYYESERSFRQAAKLDPDCALAYWGMAMSNVNNRGRARGFLAEARKRAAKLSRRETLYIDALEALHKEGDEKARKRDHLHALETIVQEFPGDIDARAWLAMVTWQNASNDGIGSRQAVDTVLDTVLQVEPMHPGAHHYRIHLWDGFKPLRAEKSAALYASTAPGIAHAWHMPGHTYTSLKRFVEAAYQQEGSARVDHAAMARDRIMPFEIHNYAHNNQWLCTTLSHLGRVRDAISVARNLVEQPRDPSKNSKGDGGSAQRSGRARWAEVLTRYELWDELIADNDSGALDWSDLAIERREKAYTLGLAYAGKGDQAKLAEQVAALKALADEESRASAKLTKPAPSGSNLPWEHASPGLLAALAELEGYQLLSRSEFVAAFERFAKASAMRPEALARAHLAARNFGFAEDVARSAVAKQEEQVAPLAAKVEVLHAVGKEEEARESYRKLKALAKAADRDLPVFRRLAPVIASWKEEDRVTSPATSSTDDAAVHRIDLSTLGPLTWAPSPAEPFSRLDTEGKRWSLVDHRGKNVLLLLYLGGKCPHCLQQLQDFGKELAALKALNTELIAVSTDDLEATRTLKANPEKVTFPMPLLADPGLEIFKAYRAFDDFEGRPLHATFVIDPTGLVRYQRISAEPFLDIDFLKTELARMNKRPMTEAVRTAR